MSVESWRDVAKEMHLPGSRDTGPEVRVVLRNGQAFIGRVAGAPWANDLLQLVDVVPNNVTPSRPIVTRHRIDWREIVAMSGTAPKQA